jgi:acyl-coenzyme A thioesterase PaaI-like protein
MVKIEAPMEIPAGMQPVPNRSDHMCFGCGPVNPYGLKMKFYASDKAVASWVTVPEHLCGWDNLVHGGVITTILDEIMSWSAIYLLKRFILTKSITVEFLKPLYVGQQIKAEGGVKTADGGREARMTGVIYNSEGLPCARSEGTFALMAPRLAERLGIMGRRQLQEFAELMGIDAEEPSRGDRS